MSDEKRLIFRTNAIQHYVNGQEKDILPRFISPTIFTFLWALLIVFLLMGLATSIIQVPDYVAVSGVIAHSTVSGGRQNNDTVAIIFMEPDDVTQVHPGQLMQLQIGSGGPQLKRAITTIESNPLSPKEIRKRYNLDGASSLIVTQPSAILTVDIGSRLSARQYEGSIVYSSIEAGSGPILSLLMNN